MNNSYQQIFDILQEKIPEQWNKVALYAVYFEGSYSIKYYILFSGEYRDCYNYISEEEADLQFDKINGILSQERAILPQKKRWNAFTMMVDSEGKMKCEYDYSDVSEGLLSFTEKWKKKYLVKQENEPNE